MAPLQFQPVNQCPWRLLLVDLREILWLSTGGLWHSNCTPQSSTLSRSHKNKSIPFSNICLDGQQKI